MGTGFWLLIIVSFVLSFLVGMLLTAQLTCKTNSTRRKKENFAPPLILDYADTLLADEKVLKINDIQKSVDGSDASKEFHKG